MRRCGTRVACSRSAPSSKATIAFGEEFLYELKAGRRAAACGGRPRPADLRLGGRPQHHRRLAGFGPMELPGQTHPAGPNSRGANAVVRSALACQPAAAMETDVWNEQVAQGYDASSPSMYAPDVLNPTVNFLAQRAGRGPALEFAIGTGRVAVPLSARGVPVAGIDLSEPMVRELRKKPGSGDIPVSIGDMTSTTAPGGLQPRLPCLQRHHLPAHPRPAGGVFP
jgi:hypothetical protein